VKRARGAPTRFPEIRYMSWAKAQPKARINLARSGVTPCPQGLLRVTRRDLATHLPAGYGYPPLLTAIGERYGVSEDRVVEAPGGTSLANWLACAAVLDGARSDAEVLVERPTYEPLLRIPHSLGCVVRRFDRFFEEDFAVDLDRFRRQITKRTRLAIVTNLHNPSGVRIPHETLAEMALLLARVGAYLLVDEVYLECLFGPRPVSSVRAGANVLATNSLTKAYGLDGLRAGWILTPKDLAGRARKIYDYLGVNGVAPGEGMELAAFRNLAAISRHFHAVRDRNFALIRRFLAREKRLSSVLPPGGNVVFPRLPALLDGDRFSEYLLRRHDTLVVPGRFFESPRHVRISFGGATEPLRRGLSHIGRALDELGA
jgi:aspartate/methionine/tyrosine aminotransferase